MWARPTCGLKNEKNKIDVWVPVEFVLPRSLGHKSWFCACSRDQGRTARERSNDRDVQIRDRTMKVKDKVHPSVFSLSVNNTRKGRYFLFNIYFDPAVRMNDIRKASCQCCMSAINTSSISTAIAVMLLRIQRFVANDTCRTFVGAKLNPHPQGWQQPDAEASIFWQLRHGSNDPQPHTLHCSAA